MTNLPPLPDVGGWLNGLQTGLGLWLTGEQAALYTWLVDIYRAHPTESLVALGIVVFIGFHFSEKKPAENNPRTNSSRNEDQGYY